MTKTILLVCMYLFIAFTVATPLAWLYESFTDGFAWKSTVVFSVSFLTFLGFSFFSYWAICHYLKL